MTDVKERVARAIAKVLYLDGEPGDDTETGTPYLLADAALSALGWKEMVEALETIIRVCDSDWPESRGPHVTIDAVRHHARSALSRARGEKT